MDNDLPHGEGVFVSSAGTRFEGTCSAGKRHGKFSVVQADGISYTAVYEHGREDVDKRGPFVFAPGSNAVRAVVDVPDDGAGSGGDTDGEPGKKRARGEGLAPEAQVLKFRRKLEEDLVQQTHAEWAELGATCTGGTQGAEVCFKGAQTRRMDSEVHRDGNVGLGEFKAYGEDFPQGMGQILCMERRMRRGTIDGRPTPYALAKWDKAKKTVLFVACGTKPDDEDIETGKDNKPQVVAWWPGQPCPVPAGEAQ